MKAFAFILLAITSMTAAITFDCEYESLNFYGRLPITYTCFVDSFDNVDDQNLNSIGGSHEHEKSNLDVKALWIEGGNLDYIPRGIEKIFPNLIGLYLHEGKVAELNGDENLFAHMKNVLKTVVHAIALMRV